MAEQRGWLMQTFRFVCGRCGEVHEGSPGFAYTAPYYYDTLSTKEKRTIAELSDDFCVISHPDQTDRFIRVVVDVPIHGTDEPFVWGVWISLSEKNFHRYRDNFTSKPYEDQYPGWLCNRLPFYPDTLTLRTRALVKPGGERPCLEIEPTGHPFAVDFHQGISWARAIEIAEAAMHGTGATGA